MPKIEVPLREVDEIKKLRKNKQFLRDSEELIHLTQKIKELQEKVDEIRPRVYEAMEDALPDQERSVRIGEYRVTAYQGSPQKRLDKEKLLRIIPAKKLEKCYTLGAQPRPTVQVVYAPNGETGGVAKKIAKKMREGLKHGESED
jgi:alanyl-tRNA synthetase